MKYITVFLLIILFSVNVMANNGTAMGAAGLAVGMMAMSKTQEIQDKTNSSSIIIDNSERVIQQTYSCGKGMICIKHFFSSNEYYTLKDFCKKFKIKKLKRSVVNCYEKKIYMVIGE